MKLPRLIWLSALILIMTGPGLAGCAAKAPVLHPQQALPLPIRPMLPAISSTDLTCVSDDVYERLATRNRLLRHYAEDLEVIIKSTTARDGGSASTAWSGTGAHQIRDSPDD
jgi:hypothetical protein